jgi:hypothetical protein
MVRAVSLLGDEIKAYVDLAVAKAIAGVRTAVGTVVTSPSQVSTDILSVVLDGGAVAVPVKGFRGLPVFPGARVALAKFGSDWTVVGAYTNPGAGTGSSRIVIGSDVPAELRTFGVDTAIITYITDVHSGLESGYFWIGGSNRFDGGGDNQVQAFGSVLYPTPGVPSSALSSNVKTQFQQQMAAFPQTVFKDFEVHLWQSLRIVAPNAPSGTAHFEYVRADGNRGVWIDDNGVQAGQPGTGNTETWHTLTLSNGWTGTLKYKACAAPNRAVWLLGTGLVPGTKTNGTTIGTLPAGYLPSTAQDVPGSCNNVVSGGESPHWNVTTGGAINCWGFTAATNGSINGPVFQDF